MINNLTSIPFELIIIFAVIFVIGLVIGIVVMVIARPGGGHEKAKTPEDDNLREILTFARDKTTKKLVLKVQDQTYPDTATLPQDWYEGMVRLAREWYAWLGLDIPRNEPQASPSVTQPVEAPSTPPQAETVIPLPPPAQVAPPVPQQAVQVTPPAMQVDSVSAPAVRLQPIRGAKPKDTAQPVKKVLSIVEQIDEIVQDMLVHNPVQGLAIRLAEDPREGVIVWVNATRCVGIDAVSDPKAKEMLRAAVQEWERRQERRP
jgi:hypothetical protein